MRNKNIVIKLFFMFMLIIVIFLICYILKVIIMLLEVNFLMFWEEFFVDIRFFVFFIYRMFIINNIVNFFIYVFLDKVFFFNLKIFFCC